MTINANGLYLDLLTASEIELLRTWRNMPEVNENMEFQAPISIEMQAAWYEKINNEGNFYFLIKKEEEYLGMIHLSSIDWDFGTAESGMFMVNEAYLETPVPVFASLTLLDFAFDWLRLETVLAKVKKDNAKVIHYNENLGFRYHKEAKNPDFIRQVITKKSYAKAAQKLRDLALEKHGKEFWIAYGNHERDGALSALIIKRKIGLGL